MKCGKEKVQEHLTKMHELLLYGLINVTIISLFLYEIDKS